MYARAARLDSLNGRPTLDPDLLAIAVRFADNPEDHLDIVLVADDAALALLTPLPTGLSLVGVVAERPIAQVPRGAEGIAVISGVSEAREAIAEGNLLILDPERGRVLIEPEAQEFARLQEEGVQRVRVMVGAAYTPARTHGGQEVPVFARVENDADMEAAFTQGADGLLFVAPSPLLGEDEALTLSNLLFAADAMGGGDILVRATPDAIDLSVLLQTAPRCRLRWVVSLDDTDMTARELQAALNTHAEDLLENGIWAAPPALTLVFDSVQAAETADPTDLLDAGDILLPATSDLEANILLHLPATRLDLGDSLDLVPDAILAGARALIVPALHVAETKDRVREVE